VTQPDEFLTVNNNNQDDDDRSVHSHETEVPDRKGLPYTMYVVFDLETTGFSRETDQVVEIAAQILNPLGENFGEPFVSLVNPMHPMCFHAKQANGLSNKDLQNQPLFNEVAKDFFKYITTTVHQYEQECQRKMKRIVLVAHNGIRFDFPFLFRKVQQSQLDVISKIIDKLYVLDTRVLASELVKLKRLNPPERYNLATLYKYVSGKVMSNAHRALVDVQHTIPILKYGIFWYNKDNYIFKVGIDGKVPSNKRNRKYGVEPLVFSGGS
jgi:DNA polymerase III epsilon subunit-like protein